MIMIRIIAFCTDSNNRTFPTWNILLYNAIGGSGDELYGIEPMSYYIRNLALNMNISWPLAAAAPILLLREFLYSAGDVNVKTKNTAVMFLPVIIWLSVLFSRPHKVSSKLKYFLSSHLSRRFYERHISTCE